MRYLLAVALLLVWVGSSSAQHDFGARVQWQPRTTEGGFDLDRRLEQPVQIEILGRAAVPALKLLSEKTGVSLGVAPEDTNTVGERKLTVIANGVSLKAIMVNLPEALQECHWDVDSSGEEPVYLLHRHAGVEYTEKRLKQQQVLARQAEERAKREARVDAARRALSLSPEQLAELKKTDLYLASAVLNPKARASVEAFLSLASDELGSFIRAGRIDIEYSSAPESVRQSARWALESHIQEAEIEETDNPEGQARNIAALRSLLDDMSGTVLTYHRSSEVMLAVSRKGASEADVREMVVPPVHSGVPFIENWQRRLVLGTLAEDEADAQSRRALQNWVETGWHLERQREEIASRARWQEYSAPALQRVLGLPSRESISLADLEQMAAHTTGMSVVSDYFTGDAIRIRGGDLDAREVQVDPLLLNQPTWRLLNILGERSRLYDWRATGAVLVFHHSDWARLSPRELPESWVELCKAKLHSGRPFTLDDLAELAAALGSRPMPPGGFTVPPDIGPLAARAALPSDNWFLVFYASLSAEQKELARNPSGLPLNRMSSRQRALVLQAIGANSPLSPDRPGPLATREEAAGARFRVRVSNADDGEQVELRLEVAGRSEATRVLLSRTDSGRMP